MREILIGIMLWLLASPILLVKWIVRGARRARFWRVSYSTRIVCRNCLKPISLVGMWRCGCGYTYRGHLLRFCPICASIPRMVRCHNCQTTAKLPELE
jgi:hypothetical protein